MKKKERRGLKNGLILGVLLTIAGFSLFKAGYSFWTQWKNKASESREQSVVLKDEKGGTIALKDHPEKAIIAVLDLIKKGELSQAERYVQAILEKWPNYRLAHLIQGDLLLARAQPLQTLGNAANPPKEGVVSQADLRQEALMRLARYEAPPPTEAIPAALIQMLPDQKYAVLVDTKKARVYLYENKEGIPRYVKDFYVTIGKKGAEKRSEGDQKTPLGVYFVKGKLERQRLFASYGENADLYGVGAWPLSFPNEWDTQQGRTGSNIWLHGSPSDTYARAPQASNGCVVLTNPDMTDLGAYLQNGLTPVVIGEGVEWIDEKQWKKRQTELKTSVETWRQDWESLDVNRYLAHYSSRFVVDRIDYARWRTQKLQVSQGKTWAKIAIKNVMLFAYPHREEMVMVTFDQHYESNNLVNTMKKRQYWVRENNTWKIIYEGNA